MTLDRRFANKKSKYEVDRYCPPLYSTCLVSWNILSLSLSLHSFLSQNLGVLAIGVWLPHWKVGLECHRLSAPAILLSRIPLAFSAPKYEAPEVAYRCIISRQSGKSIVSLGQRIKLVGVCLVLQSYVGFRWNRYKDWIGG
jgi:hypothetical protein